MEILALGRKKRKRNLLRSLKGRTRTQVDPNAWQMLRAFSVGQRVVTLKVRVSGEFLLTGFLSL